MSKHLLISGKAAPLKGEYLLSPDVKLAQVLMLLSLLSASEKGITNLTDSPGIDKVIEVIKFLGVGVEREGEELTLKTDKLSVRAVPPDFDLSLNLSLLLFVVLLYRFKEAAFPLFLVDKLPAFESVLEDLAFESKKEDGYLLVSAHDKLEFKRLLEDLVLTVRPYFSPQKLSFIQRFIQKADKVELSVPYSSSEAVIVAALAVLTGGDLVISPVRTPFMTTWLSKLDQIGVNYRLEDGKLRIWRETEKELKPLELDLLSGQKMPLTWLAVLVLLAAYAKGETRVKGVPRRFPWELLKERGVELSTIPLETEDSIDPGLVELRVFGPTDLVGKDLKINKRLEGVVAFFTACVFEGQTELIGFEKVSACYPKLVENLRNLGMPFTTMEVGDA